MLQQLQLNAILFLLTELLASAYNDLLCPLEVTYRAHTHDANPLERREAVHRAMRRTVVEKYARN